MTDFAERIDHLIEQVGVGKLRAETVVDQVYAKYQELADIGIRHGGQHHYLRDSLLVPMDEHMQRLADSLLTTDGSDIKAGMADVADALSDGVRERAPVEFDNLRRSGHASAYDDGALYHDVPAEVPRLSREQLSHRERHAGGSDA